MFYRGTHGLVDIPPLKDLLPKPCKNTRNFHPKKYQPLTCNTNCYVGTFYPSTANLLNALPPATLDQPNIAKFKDELDRLKKGESERVGRKALFSSFLLMPFLFSFGRLLGRIPRKYVSLCVKLSIRNACLLFKS